MFTGPKSPPTFNPPQFVRLHSSDLSSHITSDDARLCQSQPEHASSLTAMNIEDKAALHSFTQPAQMEDLFVSTQLLATQSSNASQVNMIKYNNYIFLTYICILDHSSPLIEKLIFSDNTTT